MLKSASNAGSESSELIVGWSRRRWESQIGIVSGSVASKLALEVLIGMDPASHPGRVELAQVVTEAVQRPFGPAFLFAAE